MCISWTNKEFGIINARCNREDLREMHFDTRNYKFFCTLSATDCPVWSAPFRNSVLRIKSDSFRHIVGSIVRASTHRVARNLYMIKQLNKKCIYICHE
jgi:hypothetical protein